jgi:hypothetical protein
MTFRTLLRPLALVVLATPMAQAQTPAGKTPTQAAAPAPDPDYVTTRAFKNRLFRIQHRSAYQLRDILRPLGSGFKGAEFSATESDGMKTISVRDFPENLAAMEEALTRLDVPMAAPREVELHLHVLFASKQEGPSEGVPDELKEVLAALKSTLSYRSYTLGTTFVQRAASGSLPFTQGGRGQVEVKVAHPKGERETTPVRLDWAISELQLEATPSGPANLILNKFDFTASEGVGAANTDLARMRTNLSMKDGEKVVVGTTTIKDKGLIVVLTAKVLN